MAKTKKPTAQERLASLEAKYADLVERHNKLVDAFVEDAKVRDKNNDILRKFGDGVVADLKNLFAFARSTANVLDRPSMWLRLG